MNSDIKSTIIAFLGFTIILLGIIGGTFVYSGMDSPLSTVMSESMQHENGVSSIGTIDTADMVILRNPDYVEIQSYVEGYNSGHSTFGEYGDVLVYYRLTSSGNPIIHRAILYVEDNGDGTWKGLYGQIHK